jgi:signal transduction histidine kinase
MPRCPLLLSTKQSETNGIVITVSDSWPGIDLEDRERVFRAFYATKPIGVGMGLSICHGDLA